MGHEKVNGHFEAPIESAMCGELVISKHSAEDKGRHG
jgi:hypothetical protein